jgi:Tfp pilus assembly protein PilN
MPVFDLTMNVITFLVSLVMAALFGFLLRSKQLAKRNRQIAALEKEVVDVSAEILEVQKEYCQLQSSMKETKEFPSPVVSIKQVKEDTA